MMKNDDNTPAVNLDILDRSIEDIEELPGFDVPPMGTYQLLVSAEAKNLPGKNDDPPRPVVTLNYEVVDTVKLADRNEQTPVAGTQFGELFMLENEYGESNLRKSLMPYAKHFGTSNLRQLVTEKVQQVTITATLKHRFNKKAEVGSQGPFAQVVNVVIA